MADEMYSLYCLTEMFYGECKGKYDLFQSILVHLNRHNRVSQKTKIAEKVIAAAAKETGFSYSKAAGGYARQKPNSSTPRAAKKKRRVSAQQASGGASDKKTCRSCGQVGHLSYMAVCPNFASFKSKKQKAAEGSGG